MTNLKDWFNQKHKRPLKVVALLLIAVWSAFAYMSYETVIQKQELAATQTAALLRLPIDSKDRAMSESVLEALVTQSGASAAVLCEGRNLVLSTNEGNYACREKPSFAVTQIERPIPGSSSLRLDVRFDLLKSFAPILSFLALALSMIIAAFFFLQGAERDVERAVLDPLQNKLFTDDEIDILELSEIRDRVREAQTLEAEKAVSLVMREQSQQIAHDIRSPVAAIKELLKFVTYPSEELRVALATAIDRANSVANDLLDTEVRKVSRERSKFKVREVLDRIVTEKRPLFPNGSINIIGETEDEVSSVLRAEDLLRILSNLVDNAILASGKGGDIFLSERTDGGLAVIEVRDQGIGMSEELLLKLGEKGFTSRTHGQALGTGLGVYSAKTKLESLGGSIAYQSAAGDGTRVCVSFPAAISVKTRNVDLVMIDNESLNQLVWKHQAAEREKQIQCFSSIEEFLESEVFFDRSTPIFLDSDLGSGVKGEKLAPALKELGFKHVFLATSHVHLQGESLDGIEAVIDKSFDRAIEHCDRARLV